MIFRNYNDFEIVNLIKQGNEEAFNFMVNKYKYFIAKKIRTFNFADKFDDIYQEALMVLHKSILKFDESFDKTFMRYFELNLVNRLITIKKKQNRYGEFLATKLPILCEYVIKEDTKSYISETEIKVALKALSEFEKMVFQTKIIEKRTIRETATKLNCNEKKIYNSLDRIKKKIKLQLLQ
ncbi:sigma-70 family RNA polymerase sigma factor [Mycoplasmatota bacterium WC30]